jgi:hypothetical protein
LEVLGICGSETKKQQKAQKVRGSIYDCDWSLELSIFVNLLFAKDAASPVVRPQVAHLTGIPIACEAGLVDPAIDLIEETRKRRLQDCLCKQIFRYPSIRSPEEDFSVSPNAPKKLNRDWIF